MGKERPGWLPDTVLLTDYAGNCLDYVEAIYKVFHRDFIESKPFFRGLQVKCRRDPLSEGKEAAFWHCIQEGAEEAERTPDLRRCERIGWVRAVIENSEDPRIKVWQTRRKRDQRFCLWYDEEYLVVLGKRRDYYQLITAYVTDRNHTRRKLRKDFGRNS